MSDSIPFDIQVEIMKRLPVKSLIRFRCVSKPWKSLIESPGFIADHHTQPRQHHRLLVSYEDQDYSQFRLRKYLCIVDDDDGFPKHNFPLSVPMSVHPTQTPRIIGSSHGLICFYNYLCNDYHTNNTVILWNPSVRKSVVIMVPNVLDFPYDTVVGFGVCPGTCDPKLVEVTRTWQVKVFTLSSRDWKSPSCTNLPRKSIYLKLDQVVIDGIIYFLAYDSDIMDGSRSDMIISFDLRIEEFEEIYIPNRLALESYIVLSISKRGESLVVLGRYFKNYKRVCDVWMMEHGVLKSFTKLYTVKAPDNLAYVSGLGFRKNGELIVEMQFDNNKSSALGIFDHSLERINDLGLYGNYCSFYASSYSETLFLLNQYDSIIY